MQLTGAFNNMQLLVVAASIVTTPDGRVRDVFKVTDQQHKKVQCLRSGKGSTCSKPQTLLMQACN